LMVVCRSKQGLVVIRSVHASACECVARIEQRRRIFETVCVGDDEIVECVG